MKGYVGWLREKLGQAVAKVQFARNVAPFGDVPVYRVVASYYYDFTEEYVNIRHGDDESSFKLPMREPLYWRGATQVYVVDFDTHTQLGFSSCVTLGILPSELAQALKVKQLGKLNREKRTKESNMWLFAGIVLTAVVCTCLGLFIGYYLTSTGALGHVAGVVGNMTVAPTPILVNP